MKERQYLCLRDCGDMNPGSACPDCGHWTGLHPSVVNPAIQTCLVCKMIFVWHLDIEIEADEVQF